MADEFERRSFATTDEAHAWFDEHGADTPGLSVLLAKKKAFPSVTWEELVQVLLCHGWIDGRSNRFDDTGYLIRVTPRRKRSIWSAKNVATVAELTAEGLMRPAGLAQVEAAQADGRWEQAYAGPAAMTEPEDLTAALAATPGARGAFDALPKTARYAVLHRVTTKRTTAGRAATIADLVDRVATGKPI